MIILGIDPGTATTGFAVLATGQNNREKPLVIDFGCIQTTANSPAGERLVYIHEELNLLIKKHKPHIISVESLFFFKNQKTVMPVSQARGVILFTAAKHGIPTMEFTPLQVKMTVVGYGKAEKKQVQAMTKELLDFGDLDQKASHRKRDDAADALGIALCALLQPSK